MGRIATNGREVALSKYKSLELYRMALLVILMAPIPAAAVALNGSLLSPQLITFIMICGNAGFLMTSMLNKMSLKANILATPVMFAFAITVALVMFITGVDYVVILVTYPILCVFGDVLAGVQGSKVHDALKNSFGEGFDMAAFQAKKTTIGSGCGIGSQLVSVAFYTATPDIDPMYVMILLEVAAAIMIAGFSVTRYKLLKKMAIL